MFRPAPLTFLLALSLGILDSRTSVGQDPSTREYKFKAASLYHFGQHVEWPRNAGPADGKVFVIGVLGPDPFGNILDNLLAGQTVQDKKIVLHRFKTIKDYKPCHILFISGQEVKNEGADERRARALAKTKGAPVLTVSDTPGFAQKGVMINLYINEENNLAMEINLGAAKRASLTPSARLLNLPIVKIVSDDKE